MKRARLNRILALVLMLVLTMSIFSACGEGNSGDGNNNPSGGQKGYVYVPEYINLPSEIENMQNVSYYQDKVYFTSNVPVEQEGETSGGEDGGVGIMPMPRYRDYYSTYETKIFKMNIDGTELEALAAYESLPVPEGLEGSNDVIALSIDNQGTICVVEQGYYYHYDESENYIDDGRSFNVRKLDDTGAEIDSLDLSSLSEQNDLYIYGMSMDNDGNIYFSDGGQTVYVYDAQGTKKFELNLTGWISSIIKLGDGSVAVSTYEETGTVLKPIDAALGDWKEDIPMPINAWNTYPGIGEYLVFFSDGNNLYGYKEGAAESEKLLNWIDCDIDGNNISSITVLQDGRVACITNNYNYVDYSSNMEIALLTKTDASEVPQKTRLTMATFYMDYALKGEIIKFNKKNGKYRISVTDYSEYNTAEDYSAGLLKLSTEIISGNVPDILYTNQQIPVDKYISKGLLEDLYPFLENDPELSRDSVVQEVFKTLEKDGKLYQICSNFNIFSVVGDANRIGGEPGWTMDELNEVLRQAPEGTMAFMPYFTRRDMLQMVLTMNMSEYVDWYTGECSFDSDGFIKLLEFVNTFPEEYSWEDGEYIDENQMIQSGQLLLHMMYLADFADMQMYNALFGGNMVFKGFPCDSRNGNAMVINSGLAMSSKCKDKDGAWEFMRILISEDYQREGWFWGFPTNKAVFDEKIKDAMTPHTYEDENGNTVEEPKMQWYVNDAPVSVNAMSQEELDLFMDLLKDTDRLMSYDSSMMSIIEEEAASFFSGQKTASDCASVIQSRVSIYVNEQK